MMAAPAAKEENAAAALLARHPLPAGAGWAEAARAAAEARLLGMGLPGRRDEYWRFTDPAGLTVPDAPRAAVLKTDEAPVFGSMDRLRIVFTDGVLDLAASDPLALEHVEIVPLAEALARDIHWARDLHGVLEARGQAPVPRPLAALNTARAGQGLAIRVTGRAPRPVSLVYRHLDEASDALVHHLIRVEPGASLTLLENGPGAARFNTVMEADIAEGGTLHHIRAQGRDHERRAVTHCFARLASGATYKSFTLTANGRLTRNEQVVELAGPRAVVHLAGAALGDAVREAFHHDDTVFVIHAAEDCESRQVFKKVLRNGAVGVFQGKILVRPGAQRTDGYQLSQSLLLDEASAFSAKPELEIYADDVKCSHGSTTGAIDDDLLFYLRARGVPRDEAQNLLVLAFLAEAIAEIEDAALAEEIRGRLEGWLARHRSG